MPIQSPVSELEPPSAFSYKALLYFNAGAAYARRAETPLLASGAAAALKWLYMARCLSGTPQHKFMACGQQGVVHRGPALSDAQALGGPNEKFLPAFVAGSYL